jgi:hypothetical protein
LQSFNEARRAPLGPGGWELACLFDTDGRLTGTATIHAAVWKEMFDGSSPRRAQRAGEPFRPFSAVADYVDGRRRYDGVRSFLGSRGIMPPQGSASGRVHGADGGRAREA